MLEDPSRHDRLGLSVAWGYVFGPLLMVFVFVILVPDADGPSPWDGEAFRAGLLEMTANFRLLDELVDLGFVRAADVGSGFLTVDLDLVAVSDRKFGWAALYVAIALISVSLLLRAMRQRLLGRHAELPPQLRGQVASYFYGRGINLFFPFGPGDHGIVRTLVDNGANERAAILVVSYGRVLELLAIVVLLIPGLAYLGWGGAVATMFWTLVLVTAVVTLTRPLGWTSSGDASGRPMVFHHVWEAFGGRQVIEALRDLMRRPARLLGLLTVSVGALVMEVSAYWYIKQAFSSPMDDYVLMKNLPAISFGIVAIVAALTRIIPYTFASFGVYELVSILMFRAFGEGFLTGTTVTLLDSLLVNVATLLFFAFTIAGGRLPSIVDTWSQFFQQSAREKQWTTNPR